MCVFIDFYNTGILTWKGTNYIQQIKHLHGLENRGSAFKAWHRRVLHDGRPGWLYITSGRILSSHLSERVFNWNAGAGWHAFIESWDIRTRRKLYIRQLGTRGIKNHSQGHRSLVAWPERELGVPDASPALTSQPHTVSPWVPVSPFICSVTLGK